MYAYLACAGLLAQLSILLQTFESCALLQRRGCNGRRCNVSEQPNMLLRLGARAHVNTAGKSFVSVGPSVWMRAVAAAMGKQLGVDRGGLDVLIDNARAAVSAVHGRL